MKISPFHIFSIILIIWIFSWNTNLNEKFDLVSGDTKIIPDSFQKYADQDLTYDDLLTGDAKPKISCCLVEKRFLPNSKEMYNGSFTYTYKKMNNENCNLDKFRLDNNKQLFISGHNNWSNENCSKTKSILGSCRFVNKECIDFVTPDFCKKLNMKWSSNTCQTPLDYKWEDRAKISIPKLVDDGTFKLFDKESKINKNPKEKQLLAETNLEIETSSVGLPY
jgi:hypothetical protein